MLSIEPADPASPEVAALIAHHLDGMHALSPVESVHALDAAGLGVPGMALFAARSTGSLAGIGALKALDAERVEIKSMRVADAFRGTGVGRALLDHLLAVARQRGFTSVWLETGSGRGFEAARSLYERNGFTRCEPFEGYVLDPESVFMTRRL